MDKSDNYGGGVPEDVFNDIADACIRTPLAGLTPNDRISLLAELLFEEHAATKGGPGQTGIPDAMALFDELRKRMKALRASPLAGVPTAATAVGAQLKIIGKQWGDVGPVHPAFYTFT
jgi:hypothetical protein